MNADSPTYYPPRAKGLGRLRKLGPALSRLFAPALRPVLGQGGINAGLLFPGIAFRFMGYYKTAWILFAGYLALTTWFFFCVAYESANFAMMGMMALHAISVAVVVRVVRPLSDFPTRCAEGLGIFVSIGLLYMVTTAVLTQVIEPMHINGAHYVVNRLANRHQIQRGDWISYNVVGGYDSGYRVSAGMGLGEVRAVAGDVVDITPTELKINGIAQPRLDGMPEVASLLIPKDKVFVWTDFQVNARRPDTGMAAEMRLRASVISVEHVRGKIFRYWFFKKQV